MSTLPVKKTCVSYWPVQKDNGQYNFGPKFVRRAMPWFEQFWHANQRYPEADEIMAFFGCTLQQVASLNTHRFWLQALDRRGIARPGISGLNDKQIAAIALLTNFNLVEPVQDKLGSIGVSEEELNGWYQNPEFTDELTRRADHVLHNISSDATMGLARLIKDNDFRAIKFYFDITGKSQSPEAINVKQAMQILVEAVQKHVKDPEILKAIGDEVNTMRAIKGL